MSRRSWLIVLVVTTAAVQTGCNRGAPAPPPPPPPAQGLGSFSHDGTTAWYITRADRLTVLVWIDSAIRGGTKETDGVVQAALHTWPGDKPLDIQIRGTTLTLNDRDYGLDAGSVFLVHTKEGPIRVVQLPRQAEALTSGSENLTKLARDDAEIGAFVTAATSRPATAPAAGE